MLFLVAQMLNINPLFYSSCLNRLVQFYVGICIIRPHIKRNQASSTYFT